MPTPSSPPAEPSPHSTSAHTSADWWVTAVHASDNALIHLGAAESAPALLHTLAEISRAHTATGEALGAATNALLAAGHSWDAVADALGYPDAPSAREATADARDSARQALLARLSPAPTPA